MDATRSCLSMPRVAGTATRVVVPFYPVKMCGHGVGLHHAQRHFPSELSTAGLSRSAWETLVQELSKAQRFAPPGACLLLTIIPYTCPLFVLPFCLLSSRYQIALTAALARYNRDELESRGLYATLQTAEWNLHCTPMHINADSTASWLAISVTPQDAARLKAEPMLWTPDTPCPSSASKLVPHPCPCGTCACGVECVV